MILVCIVNRRVSDRIALNIIYTILAAGFLLAALDGFAQAPAVGAQKPNIILILADDLGYGDIQAYNSQSQNITPNLNRLAAEGLVFTDAHSGSSVCTPTRYGLLTGRYAFRSPLKKGVLGGYSPPLIQANYPTLATMLGQSGYETAVIGKWHLGLRWQNSTNSDPEAWNVWPSPEGIDISKSLSQGPNQLGFDYSLIIPSSLDIPPYVYYENGEALDKDMVEVEGKNEPRGVFWRTGQASRSFNLPGTLDFLAQKTLSYIKGSASGDKPFFLYLPLTSPHTPWLPDTAFVQSSKNGIYGAFVNHTDAVLGRILDLLDELKIADNTLVIFTSDNGADWKPSDLEKYPAHRANGPLRGQKSDIFEGGHRIPFIVRWPQLSTPSTTHQLLVLTDVYASLASVVGGSIPEGVAADSYDFSSLILNQPRGSDALRHVAIHHSVNGVFAIRKGQWKYIDTLGSGGWTITPEETDKRIKGQLYDLSEDLGEERNLYLKYPAVVEELRNALHRQVEE